MGKCQQAFWVCFLILCVMCATFIGYFCGATSHDPEIILAKGNAIPAVKSTGGPSEPNHRPDPTGVASVQDLATHIPVENEGSNEAIGADAYLSQITGFYQFVISILLGIITIVLALSFIYLRFTSRLQTEEVAREALETESFRIVLGKLVNDQFVASKNKGDIADIMSSLSEFDTAFVDLKDIQERLEKRITFMEKVMTTKSYQATIEEETDGNT